MNERVEMSEYVILGGPVGVNLSKSKKSTFSIEDISNIYVTLRARISFGHGRASRSFCAILPLCWLVV